MSGESRFVEGSWPPRAVGTLFKSHQPDATTGRKVKKSEKDAALAKAYAEVDTRDSGICWVTGVKTFATHADARFRREHNHLKGRRVKPEWREKPERIITCSALAHSLITLGKIQVSGDDARKPISFAWAPGVKPREQVIRIQASRVKASEK